MRWWPLALSVQAARLDTGGGSRSRDLEPLIRWTLTLTVAVLLLVFLVYPLANILARSLQTPAGLGLANYLDTFRTTRFWELVRNSLLMASASTLFGVTLAYGYAYALQRTAIPFKPLLRLIALMPLFAPSLVQGQGLLFLLGRNGLLNRQFGLEIEIYGYWGVAIANLLYAFPYALLILSAALAVADTRLYESAEMLGASPWRAFRTITLPSTRYGIAAACFVVFTLVMTDFGNPMVIGGDFNVLATEVYNQVIGQARFDLGAVIGMVLLIPAAIAKLIEKRITRRQFELIGAHSRPLIIRRKPLRDLLFGLYALLIAAVFLAVVGIVIFASFVRLWPYNMTLTLHHYNFDVQNGIAPLWNSISVALLTAALGVCVTALAAIVVHKLRNALAGPLTFLSILSSAVPGMVLGLGYILAFNDPANPLNALYGTLLIIALLNVYYMHAQAFLISSTSLQQISRTFDEASTVLGAGLLRTLWRVTLPLIWPTLLGVAVFLFMRAMVTLSAVIFMVTPATQVAAVSVLQLNDRGAVNQAAAFSACIMAVVMGMLLLVKLVLRLAGVRGVALIR